MDAQRFPLDMPIDHDATAAVADVPLGGQILVEGAEMFGVGRTRCGAFPPDFRMARVQGAIGDDGNGPAEGIDRHDKPAPEQAILVQHLLLQQRLVVF